MTLERRTSGNTALGFTIIDLLHSFAIESAPVPAGLAQGYGDDYIAGGAGNDMIFGQLGNDTLLGDGAIEDALAQVTRIAGANDPLGALVLTPAVERATDGNDWIEGNGGNDAIFGGLGADNLIGGISSLFTLTTPEQRPDGSDYIFGGSGRRSTLDALTTDLTDAATRDADVIIGDNGNIDAGARARSRCSTARATTSCTASPVRTRSSAARATTACSATPRSTCSSAAPATTGSPAAPATTRSTARTATTSSSAASATTRSTAAPATTRCRAPRR